MIWKIDKRTSHWEVLFCKNPQLIISQALRLKKPPKLYTLQNDSSITVVTITKAFLKKILVKSKLIYPYRGIKYLWLLLKPSNSFKNISYLIKGAKDGLPIPPVYLIYLTINNPSIADYFRGGEITHKSILRLLSRNNINPENFSAILDFGCGCGRVLREFSNLQSTKLYGSDYNPKLIKWCQKKLKMGDFSTNKLHPPLIYKDNQFDFIYLISVFTHLPHDVQKEWLKEFHRVSKKYVLITLHGQNMVKTLTEPEKKILSEQGYFEHSLDSAGSNHFGTYHTKEYFEKMIKGLFKIVDISYGGEPNHPYQDLYLLEKE